MRVLVLGTYPIGTPLHGGQRRTSQIIGTYETAGVPVRYLAIYPDHLYVDEGRTEQSFRTAYRRVGWFQPQNYSEDIFSGLFASKDEDCADWLAGHVREFRPTHIQLEQCYMFPALQTLYRRSLTDASIIYSAHNIEAPLKRDILDASGSPKSFSARVFRYISAVERSLAKRAVLIITCSEADESAMALMGARSTLICRNGAVRSNLQAYSMTAEKPFLLTMGSGHPPNATGFVDMLLDPALLFLPPGRSLAVAGEMAGLITNHPAFVRHWTSNFSRVSFHSPISDDSMHEMKAKAHGFFLPITSGGGSNLKTAEAILSGKWVVATSTALRGFDRFRDEPGIVVEDQPRRFRRAVRDILARPPLELDQRRHALRSEVEWSNALAPLAQWIERSRG